MNHQSGRRQGGLVAPAGTLRIVALLVLLAPMRVVAQTTPTLQPPFDDEYTLVDLSVSELPGGYGGLTFPPDDPDTLVVAGRVETVAGWLYAVPVTRDSTGSIGGFAGPAVPLVDAYGVSGGVAYGPGDVLFYSARSNDIGQVKPGSTTTDKRVTLYGLSPFWPPPVGLTFVPPGYGGAGQLKFMSVLGEWWSAGVVPDGNGTYDVTGAGSGPTLTGRPKGFTYVLQGSPGFSNPSMLVSEWDTLKVAAYDVDANGNPIVATRRDVITNFTLPYGIATDPLTGDFVIADYYGGVIVMRSSPVPPTTTSTTTTSSTTTSSTSTSTTSSSSTTLPTTSTTIPSTTTTTTRPPTTSSSTSTSTTSTTRPTTTSSTTTPTTSSTSTSTRVVSSTTSTTLPPVGCPPIGPTLASIACRVNDLLALVRASGGLGPLQPAFIERLETAQQAAADAGRACAAGQSSTARDALGRVDRQMILTRSRLRTRRARKIIPRALAEQIAGASRGISADVRGLRSSLVCP